MTREIILAGGMRTPFGDFGKSLKDIPLAALGIHATRACLERAGLDAEHVDHLVWGNVLPVDQEGYLAARYIAIKAGLPEESAALNVNRALRLRNPGHHFGGAADHDGPRRGPRRPAAVRISPARPSRSPPGAGATSAGHRSWSIRSTGPTATPSALS